MDPDQNASVCFFWYQLDRSAGWIYRRRIVNEEEEDTGNGTVSNGVGGERGKKDRGGIVARDEVRRVRVENRWRGVGPGKMGWRRDRELRISKCTVGDNGVRGENWQFLSAGGSGRRKWRNYFRRWNFRHCCVPLHRVALTMRPRCCFVVECAVEIS